MIFTPFEYMEWAKTVPDSGIRRNLAMSGFSYTDPALLGVDASTIQLNGPNLHGAASVKARVAARYRVPEDHVLPVAGTSLGIFLVYAATLNTDDEVLIERPTYEAILSVGSDFQKFMRKIDNRLHPPPAGPVNRFDRRFEDGYRLDPDAVEAALTPRTRLVTVCDPHNPSGVAMDDGTRARLLRLAEARDFTLFVDEVYRDFLPGDVGTAYEPGAPVVVASSLTKVYGLGGLRAGWLLGSPAFLRRAWQMMNLLHVNDAWPVVPFIEAAFERADHLRRMGLETAAAGRVVLDAWMASRTDMAWVPPSGGLCSFPRLPRGLTGSLVSETLQKEEGTLVVPGRFFEDDSHIRIGIGAGPDVVREGLESLGRVLDRLSSPVA